LHILPHHEQDGRVLLEGTTIYTMELRWWLGSFRSGAEVLEPVELREHFAEEAKLLMERYN